MRPGANAAPICAGFGLQPRGRSLACAARTGKEDCCGMGHAQHPREGGSLGQPPPSPGTPFPSAHGPILPVTGPAASSCTSAKAGDGLGADVRDQLAHSIPAPHPRARQAGQKHPCLAGSTCRSSPPSSCPDSAPGPAGQGCRQTQLPVRGHPASAGWVERQGKAWRRCWGFAQGQEEMVISCWSIQEVRE